MRFNVLRNGKKISRPEDYYINGHGVLFYDCDPHGVDMSGKRRIFGADTNRFSVVAVHSTSDNKPMKKSCSTCAEYQKDYESKCFNWPECSLTFDKWKKGKTSA